MYVNLPQKEIKAKGNVEKKVYNDLTYKRNIKNKIN